MLRRALLVAAVVANVIGGTPAAASTPTPIPISSATPSAGLPTQLQIEKHPKLDSQLVAVALASDTRGAPEGLRVAHEHGLVVSAGSVRVVAKASGNPSDTRDAIRAVGGRVEADYADLIQAFVPVGALRKLAEHPSLTHVGQPSVPLADSVTDEAVALTNASAWQGAGISGAGIKVGIIDMGFIGYSAKQASGDLPASLTTAAFGCSGVATVTDHGTAVAEIVYEMAPGAQLYLICIATSINLGQAKDYAVAQGIRIVNHSVGWFNTSRGDGTGAAWTPDAIVADARANGILWINSAGNSGQQHWTGTFIDADADAWHDFAAGDELDRIGIPAGGGLCVFLKWDSWPTTTQDFDVYLFRLADLSAPVWGSMDVQNGAQPPAEQFCYTNTTGVSQTFAIALRKFAATAAPRFDLFVDRGAPQYVVAAGSVSEPASSPNAMAAGAICWQTDALESYSSQGPTIDGRVKPDIAGQDATSSSVYGPASGCAGGFKGTSASAPHVTGAAALVAQASPAFTPAQLQAFLEGRAIDLGSTGKDNLYGSGKLWLGAAQVDADPGATYLALAPARLLDSRFGNGLSGKFSPGAPRTFQVSGRGGVPANAVAVTGNLTVTNATSSGAAFLGPNPIAAPSSSTLNFPVADDRANGVTVALGSGGTLSVTYLASGGTTDFIFDVTGYFVPDQSGATYLALAPARLLDSRFGNGLSGKFSPGAPRTFQVSGRGGVPANAVAVTGNLTVTNATSSGAAFLGPNPIAAPSSSTLNFPVADDRANGVTVALGSGGTLSVTYLASGGTTDFIFDVTGYFVP
jgi:subtilisin family serine protease